MPSKTKSEVESQSPNLMYYFRHFPDCVDTLLKEAWTLAIETLSWMEMRRLNEPSALARASGQLKIDDPDAVRLARLLVSETVRRQNFIDAFVNRAVRPASLDQFNFGIQAFLRLYVYQTRMARNWSQILVKEAAEIAELGRSILGWKTLQPIEPFLGALLTQEPSAVFESRSDEGQVALQTFHPRWFVEYCFRLFGRAEAVAMLRSDLAAKPIYLRLNTLRDGQGEILSKLTEEGIEVEKVEKLKFAYRLSKARESLARTACFKEGLVYIQDKASSFAAEGSDPSPNMTVLDVCSAPGGRTTYLAQLMKNKGHIISFDFSRRRMSSWKNEIDRMNVKIAEPVIADAREQLPVNFKADLVVLDPPCTATGVFSRLPSSKWRLAPSSLERMAGIQWRMLASSSDYVKVGGSLVYTTFSITVEENELIIERFLKWHPEFSLSEISPALGMPGLRGLDKCQRLYPHIHDCGGLFIAKMLKNTDYES